MRIDISRLAAENKRFLRRRVFPPVLKGLSIRAIAFYQRKLSRHTCLYTPTCSEYAKQCINNYGVVAGWLLAAWRLLRCNPLSRGGNDPAPEVFWKKKWLM